MGSHKIEVGNEDFRGNAVICDNKMGWGCTLSSILSSALSGLECFNSFIAVCLKSNKQTNGNNIKIASVFLGKKICLLLEEAFCL